MCRTALLCVLQLGGRAIQLAHAQMQQYSDQAFPNWRGVLPNAHPQQQHLTPEQAAWWQGQQQHAMLESTYPTATMSVEQDRQARMVHSSSIDRSFAYNRCTGTGRWSRSPGSPVSTFCASSCPPKSVTIWCTWPTQDSPSLQLWTATPVAGLIQKYAQAAAPFLASSKIPSSPALKNALHSSPICQKVL